MTKGRISIQLFKASLKIPLFAPAMLWLSALRRILGRNFMLLHHPDPDLWRSDKIPWMFPPASHKEELG
jgi:hypothetical protein